MRIEPGQARRVGESDYREKPTHVLLRGVALPQSVRFFHSLTAGDSGLRLASLRLTAPREIGAAAAGGAPTAFGGAFGGTSGGGPSGASGGGGGGEAWTVEATLTYLIYAPTAAERSGGVAL